MSRVITKVIKAIGKDNFIRDILDIGAEKLTDTDLKHIEDYRKKAFNDAWEPVFGKIPRKRTLINPTPQHGDLWQGEPDKSFVPMFVDLDDSGLPDIPFRYVGVFA